MCRARGGGEEEEKEEEEEKKKEENMKVKGLRKKGKGWRKTVKDIFSSRNKERKGEKRMRKIETEKTWIS